MARTSPLRERQTQAGASLLTYGPADGDIQVPEYLAEPALEYAAIRKRAAFADAPQIATFEITGEDRIEFLNRMITQELKHLVPFACTDSFWLNRTGRIVADLRLVALPDRLLVSVDALALDATIESLNEYVFAEDIDIRDTPDEWHTLHLLGPEAATLLATHAEPADGPSVAALQPDQACVLSIAGHEVAVDRIDLSGGPDFRLMVHTEHTLAVHDELMRANEGLEQPGDEDRVERLALRPAGWLAVNVARIEGGTPLFNIDFGTNSLPAETALLRRRVDFNKGCYLGQEIVARMESRGKGKQRLVAFKCTGARARDEQGEPRQPTTGSQILIASDTGELATDVVGAVTSSTVSPMLGGAAIGFAMVTSVHADEDSKLVVHAEGEQVEIELQPELAFWSAGAAP